MSNSYIQTINLTPVLNAITGKLFRGEYTRANNDTVAGAYETVIDETGSGKLIRIMVANVTAGTVQKCRITIDGLVTTELTNNYIGKVFIIPKKSDYSNTEWEVREEVYNINNEYKTDLKIEQYRSAGAGHIYTMVDYSKD